MDTTGVVFAVVRCTRVGVVAVQGAGAFADAGNTNVARRAETPVGTGQVRRFVNTSGLFIAGVRGTRIAVIAHNGGRTSALSFEAGLPFGTGISVVTLSC